MGLGKANVGWRTQSVGAGAFRGPGLWVRALLTAYLCVASSSVAYSREPVEGLRPTAGFSRWHSRYQNHLDVRRGRWRSEVRPHLKARRMTSQNLAEELKKKMIPGLRTQRLSDERRSSLEERVKAISITSRDRGEFVLPESSQDAPSQRAPRAPVDEVQKSRMREHRSRFESMSDSQKSRMQDQMRRVRPLSIEERADAVQRDP